MVRKGPPGPPALSGPAELRVGEALIRYHVVRSPRRKRTIEITLDAVHGVRVKAPMKATDARIAEVVRQRAAWIAKTTAVVAAAPPQPKRYVSGEALQYQGHQLLLRVSLSMDSEPSVAEHPNTLDVTLPLATQDPSAAAERILAQWYRRHALECLTKACQRWGNVMGLTAKRILVRDQKTLWGSCATDGTIRFNWRTVQVAPALMDYIVVHELAHLKHRSHSPKFWQEVALFLPDYLERRKRLRHDGISLGL